MRLDKYLKASRLIKRRTLAKSACDSGRVLLGGRVAKAGAEVKEGDEITVLFGNGELVAKVLSLREGIRKEDAALMYEIISGRRNTN